MELQLIVLGVQALLKYGPDIAESIVTAFHHPETFTLDEWTNMIEKCRTNTKQFIKEIEAETTEVPISNVTGLVK